MENQFVKVISIEEAVNLGRDVLDKEVVFMQLRDGSVVNDVLHFTTKENCDVFVEQIAPTLNKWTTEVSKVSTKNGLKTGLTIGLGIGAVVAVGIGFLAVRAARKKLINDIDNEIKGV